MSKNDHCSICSALIGDNWNSLPNDIIQPVFLRAACFLLLSDRTSILSKTAQHRWISFMLPLIFALILTATPVQESVPRTIVVEVYQPLELPMGMSDAVITSTNCRFVLKGLLSNYSESRPLGIRYSIAVIDSENVISLVTQSEAVRLAPYQAKRVAFKMSQKVILRKGERFALMLEQVVTTDYIWDVLTAKESLAAYIAGDYSVVPRVSRVPNQVDVRPSSRVIY